LRPQPNGFCVSPLRVPIRTSIRLKNLLLAFAKHHGAEIMTGSNPVAKAAAAFMCA